ncbi:ThiF family adenylyltransferase [Aetokthonos hydrillicola Thurmond2011]|jgi:molybdopterin/thiamine biosynthesis adenylyltransferase|uniref:ThiF family adenylyltransferase n=1 Tax=Aetokthonos hydrillicola Thurmond2011 TaxID=2712845 RepID=A0AAP5M8P4_9CYAN|nr:ThiF family adenylyltransferase [Aetokthonos hydrillicola]MBO3459556.1 ThiF family adenylyltransferase [Aetokthonos hydrillicola CCALA 1050]MBW4590306.1 ThiF family adenylyltransferase [Aetokthonos hydrillicola CCALA 1050]MDR9899406.1 ThiF family adenylyltransferase [Aetokthonos hydrillicola Thurmond2011]
MSSRYARHELIPGWSQQKLADAKVIIVGMGALGNEVSRILAMSGVGSLLLCDPDRVEESNLSRTLLFRESDIGRFKVEAAAAALIEWNPGLKIETRSLPLIHGVGLGEIREANLVISCLDSRSARLQLTGRCQLMKTPYIDGGTHPWGGEVRPYLDPQGACYGCSLSVEDRSIADVPWSCLDTRQEISVGAAVPSSALVGTWMGTIAVRFLMDMTCPSGTLSIDTGRGSTVIIPQVRDPECPLHTSIDFVTKINVSFQDTIQKLRTFLPQQSVPLVWEPVQKLVECSHCNFHEIRWGVPSRDFCPQCQKPLRPRTTIELDDVPEDITLEQLGIPKREILTVKTMNGWEWFELE